MSVSWGVSKLGRIMLLPACIRPNQQKNLLPCLDWGNLWLWLVGAVVDVWYNADKRSNLTRPVGSCILLAVCTHFLFFLCVRCTALLTHDGVFGSSQLLLPSHSWMRVFAVCSYEKCSSCELLALQILRNICITISKFWTEHYPVNVVSIHHVRWSPSAESSFFLWQQNKSCGHSQWH
jgi:hypothetical protein